MNMRTLKRNILFGCLLHRYMASYGSANGVTVGGGSGEGMDEGGRSVPCSLRLYIGGGAACRRAFFGVFGRCVLAA